MEVEPNAAYQYYTALRELMRQREMSPEVSRDEEEIA